MRRIYVVVGERSVSSGVLGKEFSLNHPNLYGDEEVTV